jgi:hypothetical protein
MNKYLSLNKQSCILTFDTNIHYTLETVYSFNGLVTEKKVNLLRIQLAFYHFSVTEKSSYE